jgi:hypothetical protein
MAGRFASQPDPKKRRDQRRKRLQRKPDMQHSGKSPGLDPSQIPDKEPVLDDALLEWVDSRKNLSTESRAALLWSAAIQDVFEEEEIWRWTPGFWFASFGFLDPETEGPGLGAIAYVRGEGGEGSHAPFQVQGQTFRFVLRTARRYVPARSVLKPVDGTATCWARSKRVAEEEWTLLTAAHVASHDLAQVQIGSPVPMASGPPWLIIDVGPPAIDAMLLIPSEEPEPEPEPVPGQESPRAPLSVDDLVAPYMDVWIHGGVSGTHQTKVVHVTDTRGSLDPYLPMRIFLADAMQPGDSGSLVTDQTGTAIGIYTGSMRDAAGRSEGVCQHLGQVRHCMQLELATLDEEE